MKNFDEKLEENSKETIDNHIDDSLLEKDDVSIESNTIKNDGDLVEKQQSDLHRNLVEASLYVAGRALSIEEISTKLEIPKKKVEDLINELAYDYLERNTALIVNRVGDNFQMALRSEYIEKASKFAKGGAIAEKYLRTLTVIALKQPILKSLVIKLRGSSAYEHIKYLLDNSLITAVKKGRSQELSTTEKYSEMFGLPKNIKEMKEAMIAQLGLDDKDENKTQD